MTTPTAFASQRLGEAIRMRALGGPAWAVIIALQAAIEVLIDAGVDANRELGPFPRSERPHRDRIAAAEILSICGCI